MTKKPTYGRQIVVKPSTRKVKTAAGTIKLVHVKPHMSHAKPKKR
jgi:hypothetical protein